MKWVAESLAPPFPKRVGSLKATSTRSDRRFLSSSMVTVGAGGSGGTQCPRDQEVLQKTQAQGRYSSRLVGALIPDFISRSKELHGFCESSAPPIDWWLSALVLRFGHHLFSPGSQVPFPCALGPGVLFHWWPLFNF